MAGPQCGTHTLEPVFMGTSPGSAPLGVCPQAGGRTSRILSCTLEKWVGGERPAEEGPRTLGLTWPERAPLCPEECTLGWHPKHEVTVLSNSLPGTSRYLWVLRNC